MKVLILGGESSSAEELGILMLNNANAPHCTLDVFCEGADDEQYWGMNGTCELHGSIFTSFDMYLPQRLSFGSQLGNLKSITMRLEHARQQDILGFFGIGFGYGQKTGAEVQAAIKDSISNVICVESLDHVDQIDFSVFDQVHLSGHSKTHWVSYSGVPEVEVLSNALSKFGMCPDSNLKEQVVALSDQVDFDERSLVPFMSIKDNELTPGMFDRFTMALVPLNKQWKEIGLDRKVPRGSELFSAFNAPTCKFKAGDIIRSSFEKVPTQFTHWRKSEN